MKLTTTIPLIFILCHVTNGDVNGTTVAERSEAAFSHISSVTSQKIIIVTESNADTTIITNSTETSAIETTGNSNATSMDVSSSRDSTKTHIAYEGTFITTSLPASENVENKSSKIQKTNSYSMKNFKIHSSFQAQTQDTSDLETSSNGGTIAIVVIVIILLLIICAYIYYKKYYQTRYTFLHNFVR